ncbi:MAG: hypothetical protein V4683_18600, partial [Bacteroidota bacterium]
MKIKIIILLFFGLITHSKVLSQNIKFSEKPEEFIPTLNAMMGSVGNEQAIAVAKNIETKWSSGKISESQKLKLIALVKAMHAKNYKANIQFLLFFDCFKFGLNSLNVNELQMDSFLETSQKMVDKMEGKFIASFWEKSRIFFYNRTLYSSNINKLYVITDDYLFNFYEQDFKNKVEEENAKIATAILNDGWDDPLPNSSSTSESPKQESQPAVFIPSLSQGARIDLKKADLIIVTASDSVTVKGTSGNYGFKENTILGEGGTFDWESVGVQEVTITLGNYAMDLKYAKISSTNSIFTYKNKLEEPLNGAFEYQSKKRPKNIKNTFPRFVSNRSDISIKELGENIDYKGGFSLIGNKIYSTSLKSKISTIIYKKEGKALFKTTSNRFEITDSLITASMASIAAYLAADSVFHPALKLNLNKKENILRAIKIEKSGFKNTNFVDTYHQMEISSDAMRWYLNEGKIDFYILSGKRVVPALFESYDNYIPSLFPSLSGNYGFNPLQVLSGYFKSTGTDYVYLVELANYAKRPFTQIKNAYADMQEKGLVELDADEGLKLSRKGKHYIQSFLGKKDYDNFLIPSFYSSSAKDSTANASINLNDNLLTINGVRQFSLSDSLNTRIYPRDGMVKISKNRNFSFNGKLVSKNFRFRGSNFEFDYEKFQVKMNKIDSITFVPQKLLGKADATEVGGNLRYDDSGIIYINRPDNKSGRIKSPEYPRLTIKAGLTVPFDQPERASGVYPAATVFFKIPTIDNDSLNSKDLDFAGTFYGGGMVPDFNERLISMPDNSLGFVHKSTGNQKLTLYGTKSNITYNELKMDNKGLHAEAEFNHLRGKFTTTDLIIYPDSLVAQGKSGSFEEGSIGQVYFPKVTINNFNLRWRPKQDSLLVFNERKSPFELYGETTKLDGELLARNSGLFANGFVKRPDSEITSEQIKFEQNTILAKNAMVKVGPNLPAAKPVLMSYKVDFSLNSKTNIAKFTLPKSTELVDTNTLYLPYSAYKTSIGSAEWNILKKTITMIGNVNSSTFTSLVPEQEGLSYNGSGAVYDLATSALNITGVPYIDVVDSRLIPKNGTVFVKKDGNIEKLMGAKLEIDSVTAYHVLTDANIKIISKNSYQGDAKYRYINALNDTTLLKITSFDILENKEAGLGKVKGFYTSAKATLSEKDKFFVTPKMQFRGDITLVAGDPNLSLDGAIRPFIKKRRDLDNWLTFKGKNTDGIRINIDEQLKSDAGTLYAGWHYRSNGGGLYTSFLSLKEADDDQDIFLGKGALQEDAKEKRFEVSAITDETQKYYYDDQNNIIQLEGKFNLMAKNEYVKSSGIARIVADSSIYRLNTMQVFTFPVLPEILNQIANNIVKSNLDEGITNDPAEPNKDRLYAKMAQLIGLKAIATYQTQTEFTHQPLHTAAPLFNSTVVLADVDMQWSNKMSSFYSIGKLGVSNMGNVDINAQMMGFLEFRKSPNGADEVALYMEATDKIWYFFYLKGNELGIVTADDNLNDTINAKSNSKAKEGEYNVILADALEKKIFIDN